MYPNFVIRTSLENDGRGLNIGRIDVLHFITVGPWRTRRLTRPSSHRFSWSKYNSTLMDLKIYIITISRRSVYVDYLIIVTSIFINNVVINSKL